MDWAKVMAHRVGKRLDETSRKIEAGRAIGQKMIPNDRIFHRNQLIHPRSLTFAPAKWWLEDYFPIGKVTF